MRSPASLSRGSRRAQRGAALIALLVVVMLGSAWMLTTRLNEGSASFVAQTRVRNAEVLNRAKLALIGYAAQQAATDSNPGRLPCPEGVSVIGTSDEGVAAPIVGGTGTCSSIGRLPWRTLGLEKLVDASGEPLWYAVGPTWRLTTSTSTLVINSNTTGDILVDGQRVVALVIAPGVAMDAQTTGTVCTARNQKLTRSAPAASMDARDYLECFDSTNLQFTTTAASTSFNDQVVRVTTDDVLPAIEAAVARRIEAEIVPVLKTVYADTTWGTSSTNPAFPFPATFADPTTSSFQGNTANTQGLLPFNYHSSSCPVGENRCTTDAITWNPANGGSPTFTSSGGPGYLPYGVTCDYSTSSKYCYGYYYGGALDVIFIDNASDITKGLRTFNTANHTGSYYAWYWNGSTWVSVASNQSASTGRSLLSDASANFITTASLPTVSAWGYFYLFHNRPANSAFGDHSIVSSASSTTGWFVRNEWYRLLYYAFTSLHAPGGSLACSDTGTITCLQVTGITDPTKQQAILVLAGRSLSTLTQTRPSSDLQNYLDGAGNRDGNSTFEQYTVSRTSNDRIISLSKKP